ncbi:MAG: hypothetical protein JW708_10995 [Vallitaleaceae bacterium]|nr:hypothetical protein [Vallitaleaceae bacterium]
MKKLYQRAYIVGPLILFLVLILLVQSIDKEHVQALYQREEEIESVIRKYAIFCYAQEGSYPNDLSYLEENYGLIIDEEKYLYYYEIFASNIMPDIEVIAIRNGR